MTRRVGFISTRLAGTDGVSLETAKWETVLGGLGYEPFFLAGECDRPDERSHVVPEAHFSHPEIQQVTAGLFGRYKRLAKTSHQVDRLKGHLKEALHRFTQEFDIEMLIIQNAMAIPMNVPLGLALAEFIAETGIPAIGHHHDFSWERSRFAVNAAEDYLRAAFPATGPSIVHVVINSIAQRQLALRTGANATLIPNVMDFDRPPPEADGYADDLPVALGIARGEHFILQPTRVIPRKRIEAAVDLVRRLDVPCTLVISHASGDEGPAYAAFLQEHIELLGVKVRFAGELFAPERARTSDGKKLYSLADAYRPADMVTYPSVIEGFGNAFLEALYYKKPIVMGSYDVFQVDIRPKGFKVVEIGVFITASAVEETRRLLIDPSLVEEMVEHNYRVARQHYSFSRLEELLVTVMGQVANL